MCRDPAEVTIYNSYNDQTTTQLSRRTKQRLNSFFGQAPYSIREHFDVHQQPDTFNCGVFSIAFAQCLYQGEDPRHYEFEVDRMRRTVLEGIQTGIIPIFPRKRI